MSRLKDLTGQKFGKLTVIKRHGTRVSPSGQKKAQWLCKCDCGNESIVDSRNLVSGHTLSCGCSKKGKIRKNLIGKRFGKLVVVELDSIKDGESYWRCECDCGNDVIVSRGHLKSGITKSCGCMHKEVMVKRNTTHGLTNTRLFKIWQGILNRCNNVHSKFYYRYGGRGIKVCDEWKDNFMSFYNWSMENGYKDDLTIDRIEVNGDYEPNNCQWTTRKEQARNTSRNIKILVDGQELTTWEIEKEYNIPMDIVRERYYRGWSGNRIVNTPVRKVG